MAQDEAKQIKIRRVDFYPDDWIAGTVGMTHEERSIYISVCAAIWSTGGPAEEAYVRQICGGGHFSRGLARLIAKGKIIPTRSQLGPNSSLRLTQLRAEKELTRAQLRAESSQINGAKGGRPNGLDKPNGKPGGKPDDKPNGFFSTRARRSTTTIKKESSSSLPSSARARPPNGEATHARGDSEWKPLGYPPLPDPVASPDNQRARRQQQHIEFLKASGGPADVDLYLAAQMSDDPEAAQRMFNLTEEWMTEENPA